MILTGYSNFLQTHMRWHSFSRKSESLHLPNVARYINLTKAGCRWLRKLDPVQNLRIRISHFLSINLSVSGNLVFLHYSR